MVVAINRQLDRSQSPRIAIVSMMVVVMMMMMWLMLR